MADRSNEASPSATEEVSRKGNGWLFVNPYLVAGVVGASLCFAWMFSVLLRPGFPGIMAAGEQSDQLFRLVFAASTLVCYGLVMFAANTLQCHRRLMLACSLAAALASEAISVIGVGTTSLPLFVACGLTAGLGMALLSSLWVEFLCAHLKQAVRPALSTMFLLALSWYLILLLLDDVFVTAAAVVFVALSAGCYAALCALYAPMDTMPRVDAHESDERYPITWKPNLLTIMGSLAEGFALYWLLDPSGNQELTALLVCVVSLVVCAVVLVDSVRRFVLRELIIRRLFLPVLAACILTMLFLPRPLVFVPCLLAYGFSLLPYLSAIFATCEHIVRCRLSPFRAFSKARIVAALGLLLGLMLGWLSFEGGVFGDVNLQVWVVVVVMFFILVSAVLPPESFYPGDEMRNLGPVHIGANGEIADAEVLSSLRDGSRYFQERCDAVAAHYGLTTRQTEVLYLLAKGRNASYIQEKLVISPHTVKAHIYTIYKKTDRHSQQDLMDLVEGFDPDAPGQERAR
ncbi:MAG: hypothetical protein HFJ75_08020 [Eggerthellaceae bacterium]|nr:hypothetical protein [Eggerthellaceae bacterium]